MCKQSKYGHESKLKRWFRLEYNSYSANDTKKQTTWQLVQGWFWLGNKITENQWKIDENIYTHFWPVLVCPVQHISENNFQRKTVEIS
jgi:hypothetical protein